MKLRPLHALVPLVLIALLQARAPFANAQDSKPAVQARPKLSQEQLEAKFKATLTKATFSGRWCGIKDGKLTPEKEDRYSIVSVTKLGGDAWII